MPPQCRSEAPALGKLQARASIAAAAGLSTTRGYYEYSVRAAPTIGYVAQVCAPPPHLGRLDHRLRTRLIHAPYNSFPRPALDHLDTLGLRRTPPLTDISYATLLRTASSTATTWRSELATLVKARRIGGSLLVLARLGRLGSDLSWQSVSCADALSESLNIRPEPVRTLFEPPHNAHTRKGFQAKIMSALRPSDPLSTLSSQLSSRLAWWDRRSEGGHDWESAKASILPSLIVLKKAAPVFRIVAVRTWSNAWITSQRSHAGRDLCVAGCQAPDGVTH